MPVNSGVGRFGPSNFANHEDGYGKYSSSGISDMYPRNERMAAWSDYFGPPNMPSQGPDRTGAYGMSIGTYERAFTGPTVLLEDVIITIVTANDVIPIRRLLPLTMWTKGLTFVWHYLEFDDTLLSPAPPLMVPKLVQSRMTQMGARMTRKNIGMQVEFDFYKTERGQMMFRRNILQITNAILITLSLGAMYALMDPAYKNLPKELRTDGWKDSSNGYSTGGWTDARNWMSRKMLNTFMIHKSPGAVPMAWEVTSAQMHRRGGFRPNTIVVPSGTVPLFKRHGSGMEQFAAIQQGTKEVLFPHNDNSSWMIVESSRYPQGVGLPTIDVTHSIRRFSLYSGMEFEHSKHIMNESLNKTLKDNQRWLTDYMDIRLYCEMADKFVRIRYADALRHTGLFYTKAGQLPTDENSSDYDPKALYTLTEWGTRYFQSHDSWGSYITKVGMMDYWAKFVTRDATTFASFIKLIKETMKKEELEKIYPSAAMHAKPPSSAAPAPSPGPSSGPSSGPSLPPPSSAPIVVATPVVGGFSPPVAIPIPVSSSPAATIISPTREAANHFKTKMEAADMDIESILMDNNGDAKKFYIRCLQFATSLYRAATLKLLSMQQLQIWAGLFYDNVHGAGSYRTKYFSLQLLTNQIITSEPTPGDVWKKAIDITSLPTNGYYLPVVKRITDNNSESLHMKLYPLNPDEVKVATEFSAPVFSRERLPISTTTPNILDWMVKVFHENPNQPLRWQGPAPTAEDQRFNIYAGYWFNIFTEPSYFNELQNPTQFGRQDLKRVIENRMLLKSGVLPFSSGDVWTTIQNDVTNNNNESAAKSAYTTAIAQYIDYDNTISGHPSVASGSYVPADNLDESYQAFIHSTDEPERDLSELLDSDHGINDDVYAIWKTLKDQKAPPSVFSDCQRALKNWEKTLTRMETSPIPYHARLVMYLTAIILNESLLAAQKSAYWPRFKIWADSNELEQLAIVQYNYFRNTRINVHDNAGTYVVRGKYLSTSDDIITALAAPGIIPDQKDPDSIKAVLNRMPISWHLVQWQLDNHAPPLFNIMLVRQPVYWTGTAIIMVRNRAGKTFFARPNMLMNISVAQELISCHCSIYHQSVILEPRAVDHWQDCQFISYVHGNENVLIDAGNPFDVTEFNDGTTQKDVLCLAIAPNETVSDKFVLDLTGKMHVKYGKQYRFGESEYSSAHVYKELFQWQHQDKDISNLDTMPFDQKGRAPNFTTISFCDASFTYGGEQSGRSNDDSLDRLIQSSGPFGEFISEGAKKDRLGQTTDLWVKRITGQAALSPYAR